MDKVHIDFETYSEAKIADVGAWMYSIHPSTEIICMAYAFNDEPPKLWVPKDVEQYSDFPLDEIFDDNIEKHAWNSFFEYCIINNAIFKHYNITASADYFVDTMAAAAAHALPLSLGKCGEALGLPDFLAKSNAGKKLIHKYCKPNTKGIRKRNEADYRALYEYCMQDVISERAISKMLPPLNEFEQKVWKLDQRINSYGCPVDLNNVHNALAIKQIEDDFLTQKLKDLTGLSNPRGRDQFLDWLNLQGVQIADVKKETLTQLLKEL